MASNNRFQRILWTISGAEIPILESEKCRTDHKRFGAVGATIAVTSFIAFLSGTSAAWYFTQRGIDTTGNIGWAMAFGLVWATLIFCIDRSLVITLKKNPEVKKKFWWLVPLLSRAALAMIIAFMVSIPLELVVFEDFIAEQEFFWNENKSNSLSKNSRANRESIKVQEHIDEGNASISRMEKQKEGLDNEVTSLQKSIQNLRAKLYNPTTKEYAAAKKDLSIANASINQLNSRLGKLKSQYNNASQYQQSSISGQISSVRAQIRAQQAKRNTCNSIISAEIAKWNKPINEEIAELQNQIKVKEEEIAQKKKDINDTQSQIAIDTKRRTNYEQQRDILVQQHENTIKEGNHFIQNFEILEYAVTPQDIDCVRCKGKGKIKNENCFSCYGTGKVKGERPTEWYFLWLIRLLFFIIELLPTVVKIVMPIGPYERMVYAKEKDVENYLSSPDYLAKIRSMHDMETKAHEEQISAQIAAEQDIRKALMDQLMAAQIEIAEAAIKQWRESELIKMNLTQQNSLPKSNVASFVEENTNKNNEKDDYII